MTKTLHQLNDTQRGWIFALARSDDSNWGVSDQEFDSILTESERVEIAGREHYQLCSAVWGSINNASLVELPKAGDGIAFYHPRGKAVGLDGKLCKIAEISVIGTIQDIHIADDQKSVDELCLNFDAEVVDVFMDLEYGIYLDKSMEVVQDAMTAGLKHGQVATFWEIPWREWHALLDFAELPTGAWQGSSSAGS